MSSQRIIVLHPMFLYSCENCVLVLWGCHVPPFISKESEVKRKVPESVIIVALIEIYL
jgi:hypothetical protein